MTEVEADQIGLDRDRMDHARLWHARRYLSATRGVDFPVMVRRGRSRLGERYDHLTTMLTSGSGAHRVQAVVSCIRLLEIPVHAPGLLDDLDDPASCRRWAAILEAEDCP